VDPANPCCDDAPHELGNVSCAVGCGHGRAR
jgi:hypothetical protein